MIVIAASMVAVVAIVDYVTFDEVSISVFYLVPIALTAWYAPVWAACILCGLATLAWFDVEYLAGHRDSHGLITTWNALVRSVFFLTTAFLVARTRSLLRRTQVLARQDGLTGLLNARAFKETSRHLLHLAVRHRHPVALGVIDLDEFKRVNDRFGHSEGDRVLHGVAETLAGAVRGTDVVGRLGGDEFAVLLPETDADGARESFGRIRAALLRDAAAQEWRVGFSIGVALFEVAVADIDDALRIADQLTYAVKNSGKDGILCREHVAAEPVFVLPRPPASAAAPGPGVARATVDRD